MDVPPGYGYANYHINNVMSLEEFDTDGSFIANNYPLVAVTTSEYKRPSLIIRAANLLVNTSLRYIQGHRYGQSACLPIHKLGGSDMMFYILLLASPQCVHGFLNEEAVRIAADVYATRGGGGNFMYMYDRQLIIPNMTFTRNGSVVRWTFVARYRASATQYPTFTYLHFCPLY